MSELVELQGHVDDIRDMLDWVLDEPSSTAPKWKVIDQLLDYASRGGDEESVAFYVLWALPLGEFRSRLSFTEIDDALTAMEAL
tara:strand:- start:430 stop:681 length:252 start_codon:yes stop_codon:yes gene_type:complete